jgi:hypothetical protein
LKNKPKVPQTKYISFAGFCDWEIPYVRSLWTSGEKRPLFFNIEPGDCTKMRRFHNPRYAPESLEKRLNPSTAVPVPVAAQVYIPNTQSDKNGTTESASADDETSDDSTGLVNPSSPSTDPGNPTTPTTPTSPDPTDPTDPTNPTTPTTPTSPDPTDPTDPTNPGDSNLPGATDPDSSSGS